MSADTERAIESVLALPPEDRLKVAEAVWDSFPDPPINPTPEQQAELNRRLDALDSDPGDMLSWNEVLDQLRDEP